MGVKISEFNVALSINDPDIIPFVSNATNLGISFASLREALGAIGTIESTGAINALPILLSPVENQFQIRKIRGSNGVSVSSAPSGEIVVSSSVSQQVGDAQLITDTTASVLNFKSINAGSGITITEDANGITIALT